MAADHKVHIAGLADKVRVDIFLTGEPDVAQHDDEVALLPVLKVVRPLVHDLSVVERCDLFGDRLRDKFGDVRHKTDDADLHTGLFQNDIRPDIFRKLEAREVVVGADHVALQVREASRKFLDSVVELVVAESDAVIFHRVEDVDFDVSAEGGEVGCALAEVAGVQEKHIALPVGLHDAVPVGGALDRSAASHERSGPFRLKMAVGVIDVDDGQTALRGRVCRQERGEQTYSYKDLFHIDASSLIFEL